MQLAGVSMLLTRSDLLRRCSRGQQPGSFWLAQLLLKGRPADHLMEDHLLDRG